METSEIDYFLSSSTVVQTSDANSRAAQVKNNKEKNQEPSKQSTSVQPPRKTEKNEQSGGSIYYHL